MKQFNSLIKFLTPYQQFLWYGIFIMGMAAMLGSLYYSTFGDPVKNIAQGMLFSSGYGFEPCELCWFARILMYPTVLLSIMGILKKDRRFTDYILMLTVPGIFLEIYHYFLQKFPVSTPSFCTSSHPCSAMEVNYLGFITIPLLCLTAFIIITILAGLNTIIQKRQEIQ